MQDDHQRGGFRFEISSFEDFVKFCALIRGEDIEDLHAMTKRLNLGTTDLAKAVAASQSSSSTSIQAGE